MPERRIVHRLLGGIQWPVTVEHLKRDVQRRMTHRAVLIGQSVNGETDTVSNYSLMIHTVETILVTLEKSLGVTQTVTFQPLIHVLAGIQTRV